MTDNRIHSPIALVGSLLHIPTMIGYNRYCVSLTRALKAQINRELVWVPLQDGIHASIRQLIPGRIHKPIEPGYFGCGLSWLTAEHQIRPALWHVLTDLPVPLLVRRPVVVTCHGLPRWLRHHHMLKDGLLPGQLADYQDWPLSLGGLKAMASDWIATKLALRRARTIFADSHYVKWELTHKFGIREDKIHVVYLAADPVFSKQRRQEEIEAARALYQLPSRFVLGVASFSQTKNTIGLLRLARALTHEGLPPLVLVGPAGWKDRYIDQAKKLRLVPGQTLYMLQNIPDDDLACIYRAADLFVNLAWEESFGLPIVEAMASGLPVIGSNRTAVPEIIGTGGLTVDPADDTAVFRTVREVLTNETWRTELRNRALRRASDFSWDKTAREIIRVYEEIIGEQLIVSS